MEIKGTPAYWKRFLLEVLAMVKQLGAPSFFLTLSCADLRWSELPHIISKLYNMNLTENEINDMSYADRCKYLNMNPVFVARHFQYRVELFFKEIVLNGPLGKVNYHVIRVEFQVRGSPHVHVFLWIENPPILTEDTKEDYISFVDSIVRADLPNPALEPELYNTVKTYQVHSHSQTCRKYKNKPCRFNFGHYFSERTIIASPLSHNISIDEKAKILQNRHTILEKVKTYINEYLYPKKRNILDQSKDNYENPGTIKEILNSLDLTEEQYYNALSISQDLHFEIHLKRPPNSCFVNNYFAEGLLAWEANMDIQPVFNTYKAITYMCKYLSKTEDECSKAMKQALDEAKNNNCNKFEQMIQIARAYSSKRECSVQEAVYHVMPELWLRKTFPRIIFANSNLPENRYRICKSEEELSELPADSCDIFKHNMLDRYMDRPNETFKKGKYRVVNNICYAEFLSYYYLDTKSKKDDDDGDNDNQPNVLNDELMESGESDCPFPHVLPLMNSKDKLKCRKIRAVLRYHVPNRHKFPEKYSHHLLFMYYPFRSEGELLDPSYMEKLSQQGVLDIVNQNKQKIEPFGDLVDEAFGNYRAELDTNLDPFAQQENEETEDLLNAQNINDGDDDEEEERQNLNTGTSCSERSCVLPDKEVNEKIRSLNTKQREVFDKVFSWASKYVKNRNNTEAPSVQPLHIFLTGQGGCGKSHLIKTIYHAVSKLLLRKDSNPEKPRVLLLSPTGVAAVNISGTTIHSALGIHAKVFAPLNDKMRASLRNKLSEVAVLIIDEISMVSDKLFKDIHLRLCEIFGVSTTIPFAGKTIIASGDFFQLPPVMGKPVFDAHGFVESLLKLWDNFKIAELTEVMRQQGDNEFIDLLNNIRVANLTPDDEDLIKSRFISEDMTDYPKEALHLYAENAPAVAYNIKMLETLDSALLTINAIDDLPKNVPSQVIEEARNRKHTETGGLPCMIQLKIGAKVMLTKNIDIADKLINGQIGIVKNVVVKNGQISKLYIKFQDIEAGLKCIESDPYARHHNVVPIERAETDIHVNKKNLSSPAIKRTQFPLVLSWATSIHKVQSLSVTEAVISFDLQRQRQFNAGQMYVAMSRVRSLKGLYLTGTFDKKAIKANKKAFEEYERMRNECVLSPAASIPLCSESLTICLLNTRSLQLHALDIAAVNEITESDIVCFTETQLSPDHDTTDICNKLSFYMDFNNSNNKFQSIAYGVKDFDCYRGCDNSNPGVSVIMIEKDTFSDSEIWIGILYKLHSQPVQDFYDQLRNFVNSNNIQILLGDFNIDYPAAKEIFDEVLSDYLMVVYDRGGSRVSQFSHATDINFAEQSIIYR